MTVGLVFVTTIGLGGATRNTVRQAVDRDATTSNGVAAREISRTATSEEARLSPKIDLLRVTLADLQQQVYGHDEDVVEMSAALRQSAEQLGLTLSPPAVNDALVQSSGLVGLEAFGGDWIGRWGDLPVEQRWEPVVAAPRELEVSGFVLKRVQYAWVGDGFGYNYEVTRAGSRALLGAVFHLEPAPSEVVAYMTPHVGIAVATSKVVWLTPQHVFFERVDPAGERYNISQYTWTGAPKEAELGWIYETCYHRPGAGSHPRH